MQLLRRERSSASLPCGLGARNTLRLEGALSLYGHEISDTINAWEARLDRFVKMDKGEFIGEEALEKQKGKAWKRILVGLEATGRGIPRDGYPVLDPQGAHVGVRDQRLARTVPEEEHRAGLRSAAAERRRHRAGGGGARPAGDVQGGGDSVLQASAPRQGGAVDYNSSVAPRERGAAFA